MFVDARSHREISLIGKIFAYHMLTERCHRMSSKFVKSTAAQLSCPPGVEKSFYWDAVLPGFGVCVRASGRKSWVAQYRNLDGRSRRVTLGDVRVVDLDQARKKAREHLSRASLGEDPQADLTAARRAIRVKALVDEYLEDSKSKHRARYHLEVRRHLLNHAASLHGEVAETVSRANIHELLKAVATKNGPMAANRLHAALSSLWAWALRAGRLDGDNPVAYVPKPGKERARDRVLSSAELGMIWKCTSRNHDHDRIVRLLLLTGARREEVGGMRWSEITLSGDGTAIWTLPGERAKNGLAHEVFLSAFAVSLLPQQRDENDSVFGLSENGFSGWSRCKSDLDKRMRLASERALSRQTKKLKPRANGNDEEDRKLGWVLHDFRRTLSTWSNDNGVEPHIVEALLNHISGSAKRGVAGVYNRAAYRTQKREALLKWEVHVRQLVSTKD